MSAPAHTHQPRRLLVNFRKKKGFNKIYKQFNELIMVLSKETFSHARTAVTGQNSPYMIPFCYSLPSNRDWDKDSKPQ